MEYCHFAKNENIKLHTRIFISKCLYSLDYYSIIENKKFRILKKFDLSKKSSIKLKHDLFHVFEQKKQNEYTAQFRITKRSN